MGGTQLSAICLISTLHLNLNLDSDDANVSTIQPINFVQAGR
jgi:hypothetical protein